MTDDPDEPLGSDAAEPIGAGDADAGDADAGSTALTGRAYFEHRVRELEAENQALLVKADALGRRVEHLNRTIAGMSRAAQVFRTTRMSLLHPRALARLPLSIARVVRAPISPPAMPDPATAAIDAANRRAAHVQVQAAAALRVQVRHAAGDAARDVSTLRVACIADDAVAAGLAPECDLVELMAGTWQAALETARPDLLLVQSAWRGRRGSWQYRVGWHAHPDAYTLAHLRAILDWCRAADVPTVFWSTEDPVHTDRFERAAELFDHVMTVDPGSIERLASLPGRRAARVAHLPLAVQPRCFNPVGRAAEPAGPAFIGSYYRGLSLARREALDLLLDAGRRAGATIYDRKLGADERLFQFPDHAAAGARAYLPVAAVPGAIRAHAAILAAPDPDVVPARVLEALACGRPVVTTSDSLAARSFGPAVRAGATAGELDEILGTAAGRVGGDPSVPLADESALGAAVAEVTLGHTYRVRLAAIAREVGFETLPAATPVALACLADEPGEVERLAELVAGLGGITEVVVGTTDVDAIGRLARERLAHVDAGRPVRVVAQLPAGIMARHRDLAFVADAPWLHVADLGRHGSVPNLAPLRAALAYATADAVGAPADGSAPYAAASAVEPDAALVSRAALGELGWSPRPGDAAATMASWAAAGRTIFGVASPGEVRQDG